MLEPGWSRHAEFLSGTGPGRNQPNVHRRLSRRLVIVVSVLAFAVVAPLPSVAGPLATPCADAAGPSVAVVVDFGDVATAGPRPGDLDVRCVAHTGGLTGAAALRDAGFALRFGTGGLLCAIDGYPADGCGERTGSRRYLYWSYWKGDGADWQYSGSGPAVRVREGAIEGWRFVEGAGSPNDPRPRHAADHDAICGAEPALVPPAGPSPALGSVAPAGPEPPAPDATTATQLDVPADTAPPATSSVPASDATVVPARIDEQALDDAAPASDDRDVGDAVGPVLVGAVIVVLAVAAVVRSRRRP
jgi:hypothetical protein